MRKYTALVLLLILSFLLHAQSDSLKLQNIITLAPLRLADPSNPGIELAYERRHTAARSTQVIAAYMTRAFSKLEPWMNFKGIRLGVDEKLYSSRLAHRGYAGAGLHFTNVHFRHSGYYTTGTEFEAKWDTVQLHRTAVTFSLFYGGQVPLRHFVFDFSSGIGLKYRRINHKEPGWLVPRETEWIAFDAFYQEGHMWTVAFPFTIRLGYRF